MDLRHLKIFIQVCETGSMTKAARQLYMTQPSVSQAVAELEQEYQVRLFERLNHRLFITDAGERLLTYAYHILNLAAQARQELADLGQAGKLRLAASLTIGGYVLPDLMARYQHSQPEVEIFTQVDNTSVIEHQLLEDRLDLGLVEGPVHSPHIVEKFLWNDELVIISAPHTELAQRSHLEVTDLQGRRFIMRERGSGTRDVFEQSMQAAGVDWKIGGIYNNIEAIKQAVRVDLGLAVVPRIAIQAELEQGLLKEIPVPGLNLSRKFNLIFHKQKYFTPAMNAFVVTCETYSAGSRTSTAVVE